ncbi:MAG: ABC transporter ATP-binding protein [Deltaproteobacteria bacterium]|nr:ABC transporter ATP-binding protein [Deltaproteobacteria bacterium]
MIEIRDLNIRLLDFTLSDINLGIAENEFFILMGPTGAGKTVLMEAIAGLVPIKSGKIFIGEKDITRLPPEKRDISIVYQDYALFPHLTVFENITYGLHFHRIDTAQAEERLNRLFDVLNISHLKERLPAKLSGGEKQRVALARALIVDPSVLLLDEPLSALDPGFREDVRNALKTLHQSSSATFLMVTHDFAEALSLAERAAVINKGIIEQIGDMKEIFEKPNSPFVADFVGMKNLFKSSSSGTHAMVSGLRIETGRTIDPSSHYLAIRPEDIVISRENISSSMRNNYSGIVTKIDNQGFYYEIDVRVKDVSFKGLITKGALIELGLKEGIPVYISFKASAVHVF